MRLRLGKRRALALAAALAVAGCTRSTAPPSQPPPSAAPAPAASRAVKPPTPTPAPISTEIPFAVAPPVAAREHLRFPNAPVLAGPHDRPVIYRVEVAPMTVGAGDAVSGLVTTSSNVASVVVVVKGVTTGIPRVGVGQFAMRYKLPDFIPPAFKGPYALTVIARNVDAAEASRTIVLTVR